MCNARRTPIIGCLKISFRLFLKPFEFICGTYLSSQGLIWVVLKETLDEGLLFRSGTLMRIVKVF